MLPAAAVEDRVVGITRSYDGVDREHFYMMVPPEDLGGPLRGLRLFHIRTDGAGDVKLAPLESRRRRGR